MAQVAGHISRAILRWLICDGDKNLFPRVAAAELLPTSCDSYNDCNNYNDYDYFHDNHCEDCDK